MRAIVSRVVAKKKREATEYPILLRDWLYWLVSFHLPETDILKP